MIYPLSALLVAWIVWAAVTRGAGFALGVAWVLAILGPVWVSAQVASAEIDLRVVALATALGCLVVSKDQRFKVRFSWSDAAIAMLVVSQLASEYHNDSFGLKSVFQIGCQWALPYLLGRMLFRSPLGTRRLQPVICAACLILSAWVVSESVLHFNVVQKLLNQQGSAQSESASRWGLRRAEGPTSHPIFCGMLLVSLFPWALQAARLSRDGEGPHWWRAMPWLIGVATFCTMSRAPQAALLLTLTVVAFFRWPRFRWTIFAAACAGGIAAYAGQRATIDTLHAWSKESPAHKSSVLIDGVEYEYTGTTHRLLQFRVYREAMLKAGLLGYGSEVLSGTPLVVPHVEPHLMISPFNSIDNHYIYFMLSAGQLGVGCFLLLGLMSLVQIWPLACDSKTPDGLLAAGLFGSQLATMGILLAVWFSDDFGFQWLFNAGFIASWSVLSRQRVAPVAFEMPRRLSPGHPRRQVFGPSQFDPLAPI